MEGPGTFEVMQDHAVFRLTHAISLDDAAASVTSAIVRAREQNVRKLLVDATGLPPFESPGPGTRYFFVHAWAQAAQGLVSVSLAARPEVLHPERFGMTVAANALLTARVFDSREEALAWLQTL